MIREGSNVKWEWGQGTATGKVVETYTEKTEKTINGEKITRNGAPGDKALLIEQEDGQRVLKLESEVQKA